MTCIRIYDPALCCPTGVCGPGVDPELTRIATAVFLLKKKGAEILRYNLTSEPQAFVEEKMVQKYLEEKGTEALPLVMVNGEVKKVGEYPTNKELALWTGIDEGEFQHKQQKNNMTLL
ncbi:arsenite efflux transporter metallochaperone ArsD [Evansella tamaricis]|uniref:Arsenite efflux transporter metallochaperone ArsD n=1 Tax=Evansella tamaricis TaxID=2069301 RepID=A0ABS6JK86_9BACI|nr:arsenite efflux transporter metallochaperone ArsD [Evansella tamaricis]MBU9712850.1 arsenite efflux transporter metallochaperone ArsD [Evansella tamaricis]